MNQNRAIRPNTAMNSPGTSKKFPCLHPGGVPIMRPVAPLPPYQASPSVSNGHERRVFIVRANTKISAVAVANNSTTRTPTRIEVQKIQTPPSRPTMDKEIKEEPIDEEIERHGAIANITSSKPINVQDFMFSPTTSRQANTLLQDVAVKNESPPRTSLYRDGIQSDVTSSSSSSSPIRTYKNALKRSRNPLRHDDFVYEYPEHQDVGDTFEPSVKNSRTMGRADGCRCEFIVPELDSKMDRIMDKMNLIETLAKSMLVKEETNLMEKSLAKESLIKAQNEIQHLRRQIILQRNQGLTQPENKS